MRKIYSANFKSKVTLAAIKEDKTMAELYNGLVKSFQARCHATDIISLRPDIFRKITFNVEPSILYLCAHHKWHLDPMDFAKNQR